MFSLFNTNLGDLEFDIRPLATLSGLKVFAIDTEGKQHDVEISQFHPELIFACGAPSPLDDAAIPALEMVTIEPQESFSWPVCVGLPADWPEIYSADLADPYRIEYHQAVLVLQDGTELRSNKFSRNRISLARRRQGPCPRKELGQRMHSFRYSLWSDVGTRVASFLMLAGMRSNYLLAEHQFEQVLGAAVIDRSPLVRAQAATFPATWQRLLIDGDPCVRREVLKAAAGRHASQNMALTPILLSKIQNGNAETKVLALRALSRHTGGAHGRQFQDTIAYAKTHPDPNVSETAQRLFDWVN